MTSSGAFVLLRLIHIVSAATWAGAVFFITLLLMPAVSAAGPAGGAVMQQLTNVRHLPRFMIVLALLTLLTGAELMRHDSAGFSGSWFGSGPGMAYSIGAAAGVLTFLVGIIVNAPAAKRTAAIMGAVQAAGGPPSAAQAVELGQIRDRLARGSQVTAVLLLIAIAAMAVARNLG